MAQPDNSQGILIAAIVTGSCLMTAVAMALTGLFERLGVLPSVAIVVGDLVVAGIVWMLALTGRLGGGRRD
jgi:hypothetical protein